MIKRILFACLVSVCLLTACDSGNVAGSGERVNDRGDPIARDTVELRGEGIVVGSEMLSFQSDIVEVRYAVGDVLGPDAGVVLNMECGAGPVDTAMFLGGLTLNFQENMLVGWNVSQSEDKEAENIKTAGNVLLGTPRKEVVAAPGFQAIEASTLGEEFTLGSKIGGFLEEDKVSMLYAGTQCFFR